jgi:hypothetical protein
LLLIGHYGPGRGCVAIRLSLAAALGMDVLPCVLGVATALGGDVLPCILGRGLGRSGRHCWVGWHGRSGGWMQGMAELGQRGVIALLGGMASFAWAWVSAWGWRDLRTLNALAGRKIGLGVG